MAENVEGKVTNKGKLIDKNRLFFGLIHYILSEQKNVNWLIRSSLIDITGVSNVLEEKPYKKDSILQDVVDYITEMKPYHVQFSHYFEHYQTASETVKIPGNDWIEPTYNLQFDSLQSYPDINKIFYEVVSSLPSIDSGLSAEDLEKYNHDGLTVFNSSDNKFYVRHYDKDDGWIWVESEEVLSYTGHYCTNNITKTLYKVVYKDGNDTLEPFNENDLNKFLNAHRANRLFYIKYWNKDTSSWNNGGINDFEEIKKELNANFKGIEINGSVFDIEKFGYDIFNYDTTDYDSPTVIYDYYFVDEKEDIFEQKTENPIFIFESGFTYKKVFVTTADHRFSLDNDFYQALTTTPGYEALVYKCSNSGEITEYYDYELLSPYDFIDIFHQLHDKEKTYIVVARKSDESAEKVSIKFAYVLEGTAFNESTSDVLKRELVYYNPDGNELKIPSAEIASSEKIAIQKQTKSGSYNPFTNYIYNNGKIIIISGVNIYEHIIMTAFDYKYLYDKIYTWEDRYGRSNNIVNLDGMGFLRARYEDDRPSEKVVSYPLNTLFIKRKEDKSSNYTLFMNDFKNTQSTTTLYDNAGSYLCKEPDLDSNGMITSLYISNINNFEAPIGKALINSEILEYKSVIEHEDANEKYFELTNFNRGLFGSTLFSELLPKYPPYKITHAVGDKIIPYIEDEWYKKERNNTYISYIVEGNNVTKFICPTGYKLNSSVEVTRLPKVNLLEDVTGNSTEIVVDSSNVVSGWIKKTNNGQPESLQTTLRNENTTTVYTNQTGEFSLKIDNDEIMFKSIYKDPQTSTYHITDFTLPTKYLNYGDTVIYKADEASILSCIPEKIKSFTINYVEGDFIYDMIEEDEDTTYVQMPNGVNLFRIENNAVYLINTTFTSEDKIETTENYFGYVSNSFVYKSNGDVYAKIDDDKFISIQILVTINDPLKKGETIHINIIN